MPAANPSLFTSQSEEWFTPHLYLEAARHVMGAIDLDPASCALANKTVKATRYFDKEMDGLSRSWHIAGYPSRCFINPPYGRIGTSRQRGQVELWIEKLFYEIKQNHVKEAILLVNAQPYKRWFDPLWDYPICFISVRLAFYNEKGEGGRSPHGSAIIYIGKNISAFRAFFSPYGPIVHRLGASCDHCS